MYRFSICIFFVVLITAGVSSDCLGLNPIGPSAHTGPSTCRATPNRADRSQAGNGPVRVEIKHQGTGFRVYRGGKPYPIKGIGGRDFLENAAAAGANSIRTWSPRGAAGLLERARSLNMSVMLGIWLSHNPTDYTDRQYKESKIQEIRDLVARYKNHPALLMWSLGNEINLEGADTRAAWRFVDELARTIRARDPNHPVITVIACKPTTLNNIAALAPNLDAVGINAYGAVTSLRAMVDRSSYHGPYLITEWGVDGHWEAQRTAWGRPIEPTSAQKAEYHLRRYAVDIISNRDKCIGSYVFLWGQKQERTPTWYSLFLKDLPGTDTEGVSSPAVDVMHFNWTGTWPVNRAPLVFDMLINDVPARQNIILSPGETMVSRVAAGDPEDDSLSFIWELLKEPTVLGVGGSRESRPNTLTIVKRNNLPVLSLRAPLTAGEYRLFVYVLDNNGHVGTANIPFEVRLFPGRAAHTDQPPLGPG